MTNPISAVDMTCRLNYFKKWMTSISAIDSLFDDLTQVKNDLNYFL